MSLVLKESRYQFCLSPITCIIIHVLFLSNHFFSSEDEVVDYSRYCSSMRTHQMKLPHFIVIIIHLKTAGLNPVILFLGNRNTTNLNQLHSDKLALFNSVDTRYSENVKVQNHKFLFTVTHEGGHKGGFMLERIQKIKTENCHMLINSVNLLMRFFIPRM